MHADVTTTSDDDHPTTTPHIIHPNHYQPIDLAPFDLGSEDRNLTAAEMNYVLDHPFWMACLQRVLDMRLPSPRNTTHDITLVTHTTISRIHQLGQQCASWPGSLVVAVYIPVHHDGIHVAPGTSITLHTQLSQLAARATTLHARGVCALHLVAYTEQLPPHAHANPLRHVYQYPINAMRNRALLAADTELVMMVDGDLVPGPRWSVESIMHDEGNGYVAALAARCRAEKAVAVLLPFELQGDGSRAQVFLFGVFVACGACCVWCLVGVVFVVCGVCCVGPPLSQHHTAQLQNHTAQSHTPSLQEALASKQHIRFLWQRGDVRLFYPDFHSNTDAQRWADTDAPYPAPYTLDNGSTPSFVCGSGVVRFVCGWRVVCFVCGWRVVCCVWACVGGVYMHIGGVCMHGDGVCSCACMCVCVRQ